MEPKPSPATKPAEDVWRSTVEVRRARAAKLRAKRLEAGLSQQALAALTPRMDQRMISHYETGLVQPSVESLDELADALGCEVSDLI